MGENASFLVNIKLPVFINNEIDNMNSPITIKEIEFIIEKLPKRNFQAHMASVENSIRYLQN